MSRTQLENVLPHLLQAMSAKLGLCCHRNVGNLPSLLRRDRGARLA